MAGSDVPLDDFVAEADGVARRARRAAWPRTSDEFVWQKGDFSVAVFHALSEDEERALLERAKAWTQLKAQRGYHAVSAPTEYGGLGLPAEYAQAFADLERNYVRPASHETHSVTTRLIAPTIMAFGDEDQRERLVARFLERRGALLPAVLRARSRIRPRRSRLPGRARWRRVGGQRPEGVELRAPGSPSGVS